MKQSLLFSTVMSAPEPELRSDGDRQSFNLWDEVEQLRDAVRWKGGASHRTLARFPELRIDLVAMRGGTTIARHTNPGRVILQCVTGSIRMNTERGTFELSPGGIVVLDPGILHDVEAELDSAFLLTISLQREQSPGRRRDNRFYFPLPAAIEPSPAACGRDARNASPLMEPKMVRSHA